ncbi:hypothetical protein HDU97_010454 [Phlyctochytrium planicorne]|nr:hypothetical protein HDU97_010454 [Phlyctochytrium planicorne]
MTSAIAPIVGRFRSRVIRDLVGSITLGVGLGYTYWLGFHEPAVQQWKAYDAQVAAEIKPIHDAWRAAQKKD